MFERLVTASLLLAFLVAPANADDPQIDARRDEPGEFVVNRTTSVYTKPGANADVVAEARRGMVVRVVEVLPQWYRIRSLRDRPDGFIRRSYANPLPPRRRPAPREPVHVRLVSPTYVYAAPAMDSRKLGTLREGTRVRILERVGTWYRAEVDLPDAGRGYIPVIAAEQE